MLLPCTSSLFIKPDALIRTCAIIRGAIMAQYPSFWTRRRSAAILCGLQATTTKSRTAETSQNAGIIVAQVLSRRSGTNIPDFPDFGAYRARFLNLTNFCPENRRAPLTAPVQSCKITAGLRTDVDRGAPPLESAALPVYRTHLTGKEDAYGTFDKAAGGHGADSAAVRHSGFRRVHRHPDPLGQGEH